MDMVLGFLGGEKVLGDWYDKASLNEYLWTGLKPPTSGRMKVHVYQTRV